MTGGAAAATKHLLSHGYRDVAFVAGPAGLAVSAARTEGWLSTMRATGAVPPRCVHAPFTYVGGYDAALAVLSGERRPAAILVASDIQAIGVISAAARLGVRIPEQLALASFDGTRAAAFANPGLTTVRQPVDRMASTAVQHVVHRDREVIHETYAGRLIRRRSCGCPDVRP